MKKILIFLIPILIIGGGTALALTMQDDPICVQDGHTGYTYGGPNAQPALPLNPSEAGLSTPKTFGLDFDCAASDEICHYVYMSPDTNNPNGRWIKCSGDYQE
ncbi:hypothetical protein [Sphingobacterium faecale]|uniref:Secreted protein n=1 Tax=Sphingobacterium faecale TaxID=2803775 RepID=A0ABS1R6R2_9SPHI|nr:hypothetical protein [Sphingobacterium faecale]MBL1410405.1 hypothetical protein [Sphingobacterium faecale]